ncbi:hypothetical protein NDU88_003433 [Pleurodeles waltl]|uniref:Uncharacterized protein n=1 Tax=Pleurodeles waltl TaxID=8319 RepID=A0AAV7M550_PLEWA|nr:hypothetical protein NDU88_003433 [Pleurodeles waltl]
MTRDRVLTPGEKTVLQDPTWLERRPPRLAPGVLRAAAAGRGPDLALGGSQRKGLRGIEDGQATMSRPWGGTHSK